MNGSLGRKVKEWAIPVAVPALLLGAWWSQSVSSEREDETRLAVICKVEEQNRQQLLALHQIARELGIPGRFEIPPRSKECVEQLP